MSDGSRSPESRASRASSAVDELLCKSPRATEWGKTVLTGNMKSLLIMFVLFSTITVSQYIAATIAKSLALKADCASMLVDALSYLANLFAECSSQEAHKKATLELTMSGLSLSLLIAFTTLFLVEAVESVSGGGEDSSDDSVNPYIIFGFALAGLLFDISSLMAFYFYSRRSTKGPADDSGLKNSVENPPSSNALDEKAADTTRAASTSGVNMLSAVMHVLSDLARSTTTLVESIVLLTVDGVDGVSVDGWSAMIVCSLIGLGAIGAAVTWALALARHCNSLRMRRKDGDLTNASLNVGITCPAALLPESSNRSMQSADSDSSQVTLTNGGT